MSRAGFLVGSTDSLLLIPENQDVLFIPFSVGTTSAELQVSGLTQGSRYGVRMLAENASGITLSEIVVFSTLLGFDGSVYWTNFTTSDGFIAGPEWNFADEKPIGAFGAGTAGGLRHSEGVVGYQLTSTLNRFTAELTLVNNTGRVLDEIIVGYRGMTARTNVDRSPQWEVAVNGSLIESLAYSTANGIDRPGVQYVINEMSIADGDEFSISWTTQVVTGSGTHRHIGLSDVHVALPSIVNLDLNGDAGWRMFSAPFWYPSSSVISDLSPIQGFTGQNVPVNVYTGYDGVNWTPIDLDSNRVKQDWLVPGSGFLVYVFDNDIAGSNPISSGRTLSIAGIDHPNDVTVSVHSDGDRWNLLGNPFDVAFDVRELTSDEGGVPIVQIWQDAVGRAEAGNSVGGSWVLSNSSSLDNLIPAGQGFMWQNSETNPSSTVTFPKSGKTESPGMRLRTFLNPRIEFILTAEHVTGFKAIDKALQLVAVESELEVRNNQVAKLGSLRDEPQGMFTDTSDIAIRYFAQQAMVLDSEELLEFPLLFSGVDSSWTDVTLTWPYILDVPSNWVIELYNRITDEQVNVRETERLELKSGDEQLNNWVLTIRNDIVSSDIPGADNPVTTRLISAYPNPFNPITNLHYELSAADYVRIEVFDMLGRSVTVLMNDYKPSGRHIATWDAHHFNSGTYLIKMSVGGFTTVRKVTLIK